VDDSCAIVGNFSLCLSVQSSISPSLQWLTCNSKAAVQAAIEKLGGKLSTESQIAISATSVYLFAGL